MPRPRSFERGAVIAAAKKIFWQRGYEATTIGDLEEATGLSRSSLYLGFGNKRDLFEAALVEYTESFIGPKLGPVEAAGAGPSQAAGFFTGLAKLFDAPQPPPGCLMINTIAELAGRDPDFTGRATAFAERFRAAFAHALSPAVEEGAMTGAHAAQRAETLAASALGVWLMARADPTAAAAACRAVAAEIMSWCSAAALTSTSS
jgi:TetR/AcrR family transcriptional repressor of nem operon